jgi:hypothetical protein
MAAAILEMSFSKQWVKMHIIRGSGVYIVEKVEKFWHPR